MFRLGDYILNLNDLRKAGSHFLKKITLRNTVEVFVLIILFFVFKYYLGWQTDSGLFMIFLIALFRWDLDSRISIGMGLVCLTSCPVLLYLNESHGLIMGEVWAEQMAVWAYYFLVFGVAKQIWEFRREEKLAQVENKPSKQRELVANQLPQDSLQSSAERLQRDREDKEQEELIACLPDRLANRLLQDAALLELRSKDAANETDPDLRSLSRYRSFGMTEKLEKGKEDSVCEPLKQKEPVTNRFPQKLANRFPQKGEALDEIIAKKIQKEMGVKKRRVIMDIIPPGKKKKQSL